MSTNVKIVQDEVVQVFKDFMQNGFAESVGFEPQPDGSVIAEVYSNNGAVIEDSFRITFTVSKI